MNKIVSPIADLSKTPQWILSKNFNHNTLRISQLLFNEQVKILKKQGEWINIAAVEQIYFIPKRGWQPYEGWVHQSQVGKGTISPRCVIVSGNEKYSYGTYLQSSLKGTRSIPNQLDRELLIQEAKQFLDLPYLWGGRSSSLPNQIASVDCSGLINLLYRAQGISIPRDAHDQFLFGQKAEQLLPGDLLYLAKNERVTHVILKLCDSYFLESPESGKCVRILKWGEHFWKKGGRICFKDRPYSYKSFQIRIIRKCV